MWRPARRSRPGSCWSSWSRAVNRRAPPALSDTSMRPFAPPCAASSTREITPHAAAWDEAEEFPRELYRKAAAAGLLGIGFPEEYGGTPADLFYPVIAAPRRSRAPACGGVQASLVSHRHRRCRRSRAHGSDELKQRVLPPVLAGEKISRAARSPSRAAARTWRRCKTSARARRRRLRGQRREDLHHLRHARRLSTPWRCAPTRPTRAPGGVSLLLIDARHAGLAAHASSRRWAGGAATPRTCTSTTCRVPVANLVGEESEGFKRHHAQLQRRAADAWRRWRVGYARGLHSTRRSTGRASARPSARRWSERQVIRHKLVDMAARVRCGARAGLRHWRWRLEHGARASRNDLVAQHLHGQGAGDAARCSSAPTKPCRRWAAPASSAARAAERIYREAKVFAIGGGARGNHEGPRRETAWMVTHVLDVKAMEVQSCRQVFEETCAVQPRARARSSSRSTARRRSCASTCGRS